MNNYQRMDSEVSEKNERQIVKNKNLFDFLINFSFCALFFGLPIFFTGVTFQGVSFEKQIYFYFWILIGLIAWTVKGMTAGKMSIKRTPLDLMILFFAAAYLLSTLFSVDKWHSFWGFFGDPSRGLVGVLALIVAFYFILSNFSIRRLKMSLVSLVVSGFMVSLWSVLILFKVQFLPQALAPYAPFSMIGSVVGLTVFVSLMIPVLMTLYAKLSESPGTSAFIFSAKVLLIFNVFLNLFILLGLYSYVSWLSLIIGIGVYLIFVLSRLVVLPAKSNWLPMLVFAALMLILMTGQKKIARVELPIEATPSAALSWEIVKKSLGDNLLIGSGAGTYGYAFSKFKPLEFNENQLQGAKFYQGTGLFFEFLPTVGILGTFTLILLGLSFVSVSLYLLFRSRLEAKIYSLGLFSATAILGTAAFVNIFDGVLLTLGILLAALGLGAILFESGSEDKTLELDLKASPKYALALAFVFMVVSAGVAFVFISIGKIFVADIYAGLAVKEGIVTEDGSIRKLREAASLNPREGRYFTRIGQEYMVLANTEMLKSSGEGDIGRRNDYLRSSIQFAREGRIRMPQDVLANEVLARVLENSVSVDAGLLEAAQEAYSLAFALDPNNQELALKSAQVKMAQAEKSEDPKTKESLNEEARELLSKAIELKKSYAPGYYNLALLQHKLKETDEAIKTMAQAVNFDRGNDGYRISLSRMLVLRSQDKDLESAENILKGVLEGNKQHAVAHLDLGLLYEKTNRLNDAKSEYERALELVSPEAEKEKEEIRKLINNLGRNSSSQASVPVEQGEQATNVTPVGQ